MFNSIGIPAGAVLTVSQALDLPQVRHRQLLKSLDDIPGVPRPLTVARTGFKLSDGDPDVHLPPPGLGQHTEEILQSIGYSRAEIERLRSAGAI